MTTDLSQKHRYSDDDIIADLLRVDSEVDGPVTQREHREFGEVSTPTVKRRLGDGSWNKAKDVAGIEKVDKHQTKDPGLPYERKRQKAIQVREAVPCAICGENLPSCATDFHHVYGEKFRSVMEMASYSWERIKDEMRKCEVLCANCHRIAEHGE